MSGKCEVCVRAAVLTTTVQGEETWFHARHGQLKPRPGPEQSDKKVLQRTGHRASELKWQAARREASDHRRHKIRQVVWPLHSSARSWRRRPPGWRACAVPCERRTHQDPSFWLEPWSSGCMRPGSVQTSTREPVPHLGSEVMVRARGRVKQATEQPLSERSSKPQGEDMCQGQRRSQEEAAMISARGVSKPWCNNKRSGCGAHEVADFCPIKSEYSPSPLLLRFFPP